MRLSEKKGGSFIKQAAILAAASILVRFLGFLYRFPLTAMLGDVGNGIYGSGYYIYTFLLIISSAGLPAAISKMVSERITQNKYEDAHNVFKVSLIIAGTAGMACSIFMFFGAELLARNPDIVYCIISLSPTVFIVAIMSCFRGYFQGLNTTVPTAMSQVVEQLFNAVFSVYLCYLLLDKGLPLAAAGGTAGTGIGALAGLIFIIIWYFLHRKDILSRVKEFARPPQQKEARKAIGITLMKTAIPIIIGTAIFSITNLADANMVLTMLEKSGHFTSDEALGLYGQLSGKYVVLTTLPVSFATALATAVVPNIAASVVAKDTVNVKRKVDLALRITMLISLPAAVGIGVMGHQILTLLWPNVNEGGVLLQVGAVSIVFLALAQISTGALQGIGKVRIPAMAAGVGAIVKIILNYLLIPIPSINVIGAVISTIGCYLVAGVIDFRFMVKHSNVKPDYQGIFLKPLLSSAVMGVCCYASYNLCLYFSIPSRLATVLAIILAVIVYFLFMFLLKGIKESDILMMPKGEKILKMLKLIKLM